MPGFACMTAATAYLEADHASLCWRREREAALRACNKHDPDLVQAVGVHFPILQRDDELDAIVAHMGMIQAMGRDPDARSSTE